MYKDSLDLSNSSMDQALYHLLRYFPYAAYVFSSRLLTAVSTRDL